MATVLSAIGLILAGAGVVGAGMWTGWRRFTVLATGVWMVALIGLQFTAALPSAVAIYTLFFLFIGVALFTTPTGTVDPHRSPVDAR